MGRRPLTKPRKDASQERSRATVDALLEATARILVREGFDRASTNRIADVAGVSIGSLYQYFPSKEALVAAVIERHQQDIRQVIQGELEKAAMLPIEQGVRMLVAVAVKSHRIAPKLHRVLAEQIPRVGTLEKVETFNRENFALFRSYLESRKSELRVKNLELAAFLCVTSIEAVTHNAVLHHTKMLSDDMTDALIDGAARMVIGYLKD
ncbi:MAG TPA: TetR/AcrR family transcriptional regulator [Rhizomicrobium sp.]|jgi:AcrR family transcriptional regulator